MKVYYPEKTDRVATLPPLFLLIPLNICIFEGIFLLNVLVYFF